MAVDVITALSVKELRMPNSAIKLTSAPTANAAQAITISNVGPAGVGTATINSWLEIDYAGTKYYIPLWT